MAMRACFSTVKDCDRIITIEAGEVVEDGTHNDLLKTGGRYSKLWGMQAAGPRGTEPTQPTKKNEGNPEVRLNPVPFQGLQVKPQAGE